ncbi:MAG: 2-amino-3,7-dideoxy-D-threo-hept-6-ulosonate synthase [Thermodesulfobacteriota bacterium]
MIGKRIRMDRIFDQDSKKTVIVPMDHGVTIGPVTGLIDIQRTIDAVSNGGANAIVIHKGLVTNGFKKRNLGLIVHLSASTRLSPDPNAKMIVCTVEEAIKLGADGVSVHINLGAGDEKSMLKDLGRVAKEAMEWGIPLLAMMYTRGPNIKNEYDTKLVKHGARVGAELGADIVKVPYTGSPESFREVVEGCFVPVVIAGGEKMDTDKDVLEMVRGAILAGAAGVSIGRNVFQHKEPTKILNAISKIVHKGLTPDQILREWKEVKE